MAWYDGLSDIFGGDSSLPSWLSDAFFGTAASGDTPATGGLIGTGGNVDWSRVGLTGVGTLGALAALNQPDETGTSTATSSSTMPDWYNQAAQGLVSQAQNLPRYQQYFTDRPAAAPLSADEVRASQLANQMTGAYQPMMDEAATAARAGGASVLDQDIGAYMSPYWENALAPQLNQIRQRGTLAENAIEADMAKKGMFGTSRFEVARALNNQETNRAMDDLYARGAQEAWGQGMNLATGDRTAQQQLAGSLGNLAGAGANLAGADVSRLAGTGATARGVQETGIGRQWQDYINAMQAPYTALQAQGGALAAARPDSTKTVTQTTTAPNNALGTLASVGAGLWGMTNPQGLR